MGISPRDLCQMTEEIKCKVFILKLKTLVSGLLSPFQPHCPNFLLQSQHPHSLLAVSFFSLVTSILGSLSIEVSFSITSFMI